MKVKRVNMNENTAHGRKRLLQNCCGGGEGGGLKRNKTSEKRCEMSDLLQTWIGKIHEINETEILPLKILIKLSFSFLCLNVCFIFNFTLP